MADCLMSSKQSVARQVNNGNSCKINGALSLTRADFVPAFQKPPIVVVDCGVVNT